MDGGEETDVWYVVKGGGEAGEKGEDDGWCGGGGGLGKGEESEA